MLCVVDGFRRFGRMFCHHLHNQRSDTRYGISKFLRWVDTNLQTERGHNPENSHLILLPTLSCYPQLSNLSDKSGFITFLEASVRG
jgi:hypothetical protein